MVQHVVIAGGGVVGAATAYYLSQKYNIRPTVVEACTLACSSSGKAGGFLALDWCDGSALGPLARKSFALHVELAKTLPDCGYRKVTTHSVAVTAGRGTKSPQKLDKDRLPAWINSADVVTSSLIGTEDTTAQVHPEFFTKALLAEVMQRGGTVRERTQALGVKLNADGNKVEGLHVRNLATDEEEILPADAVIFCLGVWSTSLANILPESVKLKSGVFSGLKVHSMVLSDSKKRTTADCLFLAYRGKTGSLEPEVYPRPDGTVYVCGVSSEEAPPALADEIHPNPEGIATLKEIAAAVSSELDGAEVLKQQACFLPSTDDGLPLIGAFKGGPNGLYVASGHSCWGILTGPATGLAMAELVVDGKATSVGLAAFDPSRFDNKKSRR